MATYTVRGKYLRDNFAVLELLTADALAVGSSITVAGVDATFNGTFSVYALPNVLVLGVDEFGDLLLDYNVPILNQVVYARTAADVDRTASGGTVTSTPVCTWITAADVQQWLNITVASANDTALITAAAAAANQFAFRRRSEAGWIDQLATVPSSDVRLGTIMYAGALYRARGSSGDTFAAFDTMSGPPQVGMAPIVKQLLAIDRPAVA